MSYSNRCMTMTLPSGTTLKIPYVADLMAFVHEGMEIRNPMMSDCGRFGVDPVEAYGFELVETGGGCTALRKDLPNGDYMLLTDDNGTDVPTQEEWATAIYGRYTGGGTPYATITLLDVPYEGEEGPPDLMTVYIDGKPQQRAIDYVRVGSVNGRGVSQSIPVLRDDEIMAETIGGKVNILRK